MYDAQADVAYWIYVQGYFQALGDTFDLSKIGQTYTIYFNPQDILDAQVIERFAIYKRQVVEQRNNRMGDIRYEN